MREVAAEEQRGSSPLYDGKGLGTIKDQQELHSTMSQWSLIPEPILTYGVSFCQDIDFAMLL